MSGFALGTCAMRKFKKICAHLYTYIYKYIYFLAKIILEILLMLSCTRLKWAFCDDAILLWVAFFSRLLMIYWKHRKQRMNGLWKRWIRLIKIAYKLWIQINTDNKYVCGISQVKIWIIFNWIGSDNTKVD